MIYPIKDKGLFLKYAIPCGQVLVKRGDVNQKKLDTLRQGLLMGAEVKEDLEKIFPIATRYLTLMAKRAGKREIDAELIRRYFWREHQKCVEWRMAIYPDVMPEKCLVLPARVLKAGAKAVVQTPLGKREVKQDFCRGMKEGDFVAVHYDYAVEKINSGQAKALLKCCDKDISKKGKLII